MPAPAHQPGVCHYGAKLACCYGWRRNSKGVCEATCEHGCRFGECVGPNKCRCFPGYAGKTCSQDVNECGLQPRPCPHRCVNMPGSYKCFCLSGYMLMPDATCANIDECASGKAICPYNRRCVNTFGSYYCKCHVGFELQYISGQYDCVDINECAGKTHTCHHHANCLNTQGSFKCKCKQGYKGNGLQCSLIPENSVKEVFRARGTIKDTIKKLLAHKNSMKKKEKIKNVIPESSGTPVPKVQPFNSEGSIYRDGKSSGEKQGNAERKEDTREEKALKNPAGWEPSLRGDVFSPTVKEAGEFDLAPVQRKALPSKLEHKGRKRFIAQEKATISRCSHVLPSSALDLPSDINELFESSLAHQTNQVLPLNKYFLF